MTDNPMFGQLSADFAGLFNDAERWDALVADPAEPFVDVPDPTFEQLMEDLIAKLPPSVVTATRKSVDAEITLRRLTGQEVRDGGNDDDRPVPDAEGSVSPGAVVVAGEGGGDPEPQDRRLDVGEVG